MFFLIVTSETWSKKNKQTKKLFNTIATKLKTHPPPLSFFQKQTKNHHGKRVEPVLQGFFFFFLFWGEAAATADKEAKEFMWGTN